MRLMAACFLMLPWDICKSARTLIDNESSMEIKDRNGYDSVLSDRYGDHLSYSEGKGLWIGEN